MSKLTSPDVAKLFYNIPDYLYYGICDEYIHSYWLFLDGEDYEKEIIRPDHYARHLVGRYWE